MGKRLKFVEVKWDDAHSTAEWTERKSLPPVTKCVSRGWLMRDDAEAITLAATLQISNGDDVGEIVTIPRGMVVGKIRVLKI